MVRDSGPDTTHPTGLSSTLDISRDPEGMDTSAHWSVFFEGKQHGGVGVSWVHVVTSHTATGPPLHRHPYAEMITIRQGEAELPARRGIGPLIVRTLTGRSQGADVGREATVARRGARR